jgi:chromosome segregation ATPase
METRFLKTFTIVTQINDPHERIDRLEALMAQVIAENRATSERLSQQIQETNQQLTQQIKEVSTQIKAQATFHDRLDQELTKTEKLIQSNAKAIEANGNRYVERAKYELDAIREVRRSIRESHLEPIDLYRDSRVRVNSLQDSIEDLRDEIREVNRKIDRQNPPEI